MFCFYSFGPEGYRKVDLAWSLLSKRWDNHCYYVNALQAKCRDLEGYAPLMGTQANRLVFSNKFSHNGAWRTALLGEVLRSK
jgi:hypothetical protein